MTQRISRSGLQVAAVMDDLVERQLTPGLEFPAERVWEILSELVAEFSPKIRELLAVRDVFQRKIDEWHLSHDLDQRAYRNYLTEIGYLLPTGEDFEITTSNVVAEIAEIAGPQLVVPVMNARYALNAANARWGSLYDALYGTDVIPESDGCERGRDFNQRRAAKVIAYARKFLNEAAPLENGGYEQAKRFRIEEGELTVELLDGKKTILLEQEKFVGYIGDPVSPTSILLKNHQLHVEIQIDVNHAIGKTDEAGIKDVILESAITTIQDFEDSVAAVDAEDKVLIYRKWLGLMKGDLTETLEKNGKALVRKLNADRSYLSPDGTPFRLPGKSFLLARNVGHHMFTDAVLDSAGNEIPEGLLDGLMTCLAAMHRKGDIYIVKPKMHGPDEVALTCAIFSRSTLR